MKFSLQFQNVSLDQGLLMTVERVQLLVLKVWFFRPDLRQLLPLEGLMRESCLPTQTGGVVNESQPVAGTVVKDEVSGHIFVFLAKITSFLGL